MDILDEHVGIKAWQLVLRMPVKKPTVLSGVGFGLGGCRLLIDIPLLRRWPSSARLVSIRTALAKSWKRTLPSLLLPEKTTVKYIAPKMSEPRRMPENVSCERIRIRGRDGE